MPHATTRRHSWPLAKSGADYLVWAQDQAGIGLFPFPARRDGKERAFAVSERYLRKAEGAGRFDDVVHNGWIVNDLGDGGLQYDNGVCGVAVLELYRLTHEPNTWNRRGERPIGRSVSR